MTTFEPSHSVTMRATSHEAPSMADQLPSINFGFDDLRSRMNQFTARFDAFIENGRRRVLEERNQFHMNVAELHEDQRMKTQSIEILTLQSNTHTVTLQKEAAETADMHSSIASLTGARDERLAHRDTLRSEIAALQSSIAARRDVQAAHRRYLDGQSRHNAPELEFWESYLGLRVEGLGRDDRLKFVFENVDERDWTREAWFELDTSEREYKVLEVRPKLDREGVEGVVERLNESRDLAGFLKGMRELFVVACK